jgi:transposase
MYVLFLFVFYPSQLTRLTFNRTKKRHLKEHTREALKLMAEGASTQDVSKILGISNSTASLLRKNNKENIPISYGGCPRKISAESMEYLKLNIQIKIKTAVEAKKKANNLLPEPLSDISVRHRLKEAGLAAKRTANRLAAIS